MPELPEAETIRRDLAEIILGKRISSVRVLLPKLVRPDPETFRWRLEEKTVRNLRRHGKLLIFDLSEGVLLVHLGMTGSLIFREKEDPPLHTHVIMRLEGGFIFYADLRQFGWLEALSKEALMTHPFFSTLGPDALVMDFYEFDRRIARLRRRIKDVLLDQRVLAGLGNIYTDEALFRAGIHPERKASELSPEERRRLFKAIREVLLRGIELRGSSVRNYVDGRGEAGRFQEEHLVYGRRGRPCPRCGTALSYARVAGRGTTFCPRCQR